ncbi:MAG: aldose 1-epimerase family protein [Hyphomicrobiales bacterium]|nr:aldose 1-epimerase family protein [Hyphomicrobiales bacterium]
MPETTRLTSGASSAIISTFGAEPLAWAVGGRDLLWTGDPAFWPRVSPVLFPTVGRVRGGKLRVDGKTYPMAIHGFAPESEFWVTERSSDKVRLVLEDNDETRRRYPFAFRLEVTYRLMGEALLTEFRIVNQGGRPLPFALGFHPGFRWPFGEGGREGHAIEFEVAEDPAVPVITKDGLFSSEKRPVPLQGRRLPLDETVLAKEALCFLDARSGWVRFAGPDGGAVRMSAENFSHWALWSLPGASFVSIEAWTGHGDPDGFAGDITEKPSMRFLEPGGESLHRVEFRWQPAS